MRDAQSTEDQERYLLHVIFQPQAPAQVDVDRVGVGVAELEHLNPAAIDQLRRTCSS